MIALFMLTDKVQSRFVSLAMHEARSTGLVRLRASCNV